MSAATEIVLERGERSSAPSALRRPRGAAAALAKYGAVFETSLRNQLAYAGEAAVRGIFLALILFVFLQLWRATYAAEQTARIAGLTMAQMIWYLAVTESIIISRPSLNSVVDNDVRTGDIAYTLIRPLGYAAYHLANYLGERVFRFVTTLAIGCALALLYVGPVPLSAANAVAALLTLALAVLVDFLLSFGIGLLAFWMEDTSSVFLIYSRVLMLLGGMMLPLDVFPGTFGRIVRALPFGGLVYGPARVAIGAEGFSIAGLLAQQIVTLGACAFLVGAIYRAGIRRVNVNGG